MIKVKQLRTGNLLDNGHNIVQVTSISLDIDDEYLPSIGVCKYGEHKDEVIVHEAAFGIEIKPIPLSPEWLERCGFNTKVKNGIALNILEGYVFITSLFTGLPLTLEIDGNRMPLHSVKYVYQLQNLYFALTGEELNVKL